MRVIFGVSLALLLGACEQASEPGDTAVSEEGGKAAGETLGGTISDDMLPLAELRSQSPPRAPVAEPGAASGPGGPGAPGGSGETAGGRATEASEPSAEPEDQPEAPAAEPR